MNKKNGFTLIEVIAVIVIIGIVMLVAVHSVMEYIKGSDNEAYASNAMAYIETARAEYSMEEYGDLLDSDEIMIVPIKNITLEKSDGGESPYGLYDYDKCYVVIVPERNGYQYYAVMSDANGIGINFKATNELNKNAVEENIGDSIVPWNSYVNPNFPLVIEGTSYKFYEQRDIEKDGDVIPNGVIVLSNHVTTVDSPIVITVNFYKKNGGTRTLINSQTFRHGSGGFPRFLVDGKNYNTYAYGNALSTEPTATRQDYSVNSYVNDDWIRMIYDSSPTHSIDLYLIWVDKSYSITMPDGSKRNVSVSGEDMKNKSYRDSRNSNLNFSGTYYYCTGEITGGSMHRVLKAITAGQASNFFVDTFYDMSHTPEKGFGGNAVLYASESSACR